MNLCATQDNLVLKAVLKSGITPGGIVMPGNSDFEDGATVISVGPLVEDLVIGDIVVRPDPPRFTVIDDETEEMFWLVAEADILAKMLPDEVGADLLPDKPPQKFTHPPLGTIPDMVEVGKQHTDEN